MASDKLELEFEAIIPQDIGFGLASKILPSKGNLVYEYNPFKNYRLNEDKYEYKGGYYTLDELEKKYNITLNIENSNWEGLKDEDVPELREAGELVDFSTNELNFDLNHPIDIIPQYSYDDSVNLIINDGKNKPRLINSRFSAIGKNKYQIVDRKGNYDTNLYDQGIQFDSDTSLYKQISGIPILKFLGTDSGGTLSIGNYHFYFTYVDADGNESDFISESGLVSLFIGSSPSSCRSGFRDESSNKMVKFILSNTDISYPYVYVYYTRSTSDINTNKTTSAYKIEQKYIINESGICDIIITGLEEKTEIPISDVNPMYLLCDNVKTQTICQNRLFFGNVQQKSLDTQDIADKSLYFLPYIQTKQYESELTKNYVTKGSSGYFDTTYIYNYTGYWDEEIYRFGIVYILQDNSLSPVFNIRGISQLGKDSTIYTEFNKNETDCKDWKRIESTPEGFIVDSKNEKALENSKGVVFFNNTPANPNEIIGIAIDIPVKVINYLQDTYKIKGFFFVRQKRIPTILCQALTIGIDKESHTPVLPVAIDNQIVSDLDLKEKGKLFPICRNKKSGEIVKGDVLVKKPTSLLEKLAITAGVVVGGALSFVLGGGAVIGAVIGGVAGDLIFPPGYDMAYKVYQNNDDWEIYYTQAKPQSDDSNSVYYVSERFITDTKELDQDFHSRIYFLKNTYVSNHAAICPEYDINYPYYNSLFNGNTFSIQESKEQPKNNWLDYDVYDERHFYNTDYESQNDYLPTYQCAIQGIEDNVKLSELSGELFSGRAGEAEEAFRYAYVGSNEKLTSSYNLIRGSFGPYLGLSNFDKPNRLLNIKIPGYTINNIEEYFRIRMNDKSSFYAISDRIDLSNINYWFKNKKSQDIISDDSDIITLRNSLYRGDCYICQFTHRINRNFQDPSAPTNDEVVDSKCWAQNYEISDGVLKVENFDKINLGDVNAIQLGMWVTSTYRSSRNLNIRNIDESITDEVALFGQARSYYPYSSINAGGPFKLPEALCYNSGFETSVSERYNFEIPDVPHLKNIFSTRIIYSDIQIKDAFKNGFRVFKGTNYRDYPMTYGSITKLIEVRGDIICVFEHGIAKIPVNERIMTGQGSGGGIYINTNNVLPENPLIISDTFGSQWADSIIKTNKGNIYGVDTVAKKIWTITNEGFQILSDMYISEFLNANISLTEQELEPIVGIRNVKTHYNNFKSDVMFTFYDNTYGFEEKVWNICYNETLKKFITFYSWVPSFSENIYNTYFSFDRNTSKWIAKLGMSKYNNDFSQPLTLTNNIITNTTSEIGTFVIDETSLFPQGSLVQEYYTYDLIIERDNFGFHKYFKIIKENDDFKLFLNLENFESEEIYKKLCTEHYVRIGKDGSLIDNPKNNPQYTLNLPIAYEEKTNRKKWLDYKEQPNNGIPVILLNIKIKVNINIQDNDDQLKEQIKEYLNSYNDNYSNYNAKYYEYTIALIPEYNIQFLSTDFWKHGQSGIIDISDKLLPTHWYGKQHPFEFEFVVADNPQLHKIFDNLQIISNKAAPESFHYEIVGECYDFAKDKKNMYIRQEATKELYQFNGSDIVYNPDYKTLDSDPRQMSGLVTTKYDKSTIFPLYYRREDTINEIEDYYHLYGHKEVYGKSDKNFSSLSGAEIVRYPNLGEYRIWNHAKAVDIHDFQKGGRMRGNMQYKEDKWDIQINPINLVQKNEDQSDWTNVYGDGQKKMVPAECNLFTPPAEVYNKDENKGAVTLPSDWERNVVSWGISDKINKEVKLKDKFIKIRVRYSGKDLAVISALKTLYSISYA